MAAMFSLSVLIVVIGVSLTVAHFSEILVDEDNGISSTQSNSVEQFIQDDVPNVPCHVEFQVMKRAVGRCMRLGRNSRGCVAGHYLHPFHPDCM